MDAFAIWSTAQNRRVLVVEDNGHAAYLLEFMLQRAGFDVQVACDGRVAEEFIRNSAPVDIVILDLLLPYVSGFQLLMQIREDPAWHNVPVIVVSGKALEQDVVQALNHGANDYVTKPFRPQELLARINRHTAGHFNRARAV